MFTDEQNPLQFSKQSYRNIASSLHNLSEQMHHTIRAGTVPGFSADETQADKCIPPPEQCLFQGSDPMRLRLKENFTVKTAGS